MKKLICLLMILCLLWSSVAFAQTSTDLTEQEEEGTQQIALSEEEDPPQGDIETTPEVDFSILETSDLEGLYIVSSIDDVESFDPTANVALTRTKTATLTLVLFSKDAEPEIKPATWSISNKKVATISAKGVIAGKARGTALITAKAIDKSGSITRTVQILPVPETSIKLKKVSVSILKGKTYQQSATVYPKNADFRSVTWESSDSAIATVSTKGKITAKAVGTAKITATSKNGMQAECEVTVKPILVSSIKFVKPPSKIGTEESVQLSVSLAPATADNKSVEWLTSDESLATVDEEGFIYTGERPGTVTITAKAKDESGKKASITLKVNLPIPSSDDFEFSAPVRFLKKGETTTAKLEITNETLPKASINTLYFKSTTPKIASVDRETGEIEALTPGLASITVMSTLYSQTLDSIDIIVYKDGEYALVNNIDELKQAAADKKKYVDIAGNISLKENISLNEVYLKPNATLTINYAIVGTLFTRYVFSCSKGTFDGTLVNNGTLKVKDVRINGDYSGDGTLDLGIGANLKAKNETQLKLYMLVEYSIVKYTGNVTIDKNWQSRADVTIKGNLTVNPGVYYTISGGGVTVSKLYNYGVIECSSLIVNNYILNNGTIFGSYFHRRCLIVGNEPECSANVYEVSVKNYSQLKAALLNNPTDVNIKGSVSIPAGQELDLGNDVFYRVYRGVSITVSKDATLKLGEKTYVQNWGKITNNGTIDGGNVFVGAGSRVGGTGKWNCVVAAVYLSVSKFKASLSKSSPVNFAYLEFNSSTKITGDLTIPEGKSVVLAPYTGFTIKKGTKWTVNGNLYLDIDGRWSSELRKNLPADFINDGIIAGSGNIFTNFSYSQRKSNTTNFINKGTIIGSGTFTFANKMRKSENSTVFDDFIDEYDMGTNDLWTVKLDYVKDYNTERAK